MRRTVFILAAAAAWLNASIADAAAQAPIKDQLVGSWSLVEAEAVVGDKKVTYLEGNNLAGLLMFDGAGHYSFQIIADLPKLASNNRLKTTPDEDRALARGIQSFFGDYTVNEAERTLTLRSDRNTFPNQNGRTGERQITSLTADELRFRSIVSGGRSSNNFVWKRLK